MTGATPPLIYYPQYCFHLSPTLGKWCPLRVSDVQTLTWRAEFEGQHVYFYLNHPIKWVRVAGVVVAYNEYNGRLVYTVDDGSGMTMECTMVKPKDPPKKPGQDGAVEAAAPTAVAVAVPADAAKAAGPADTDKPAPPVLGDVIGVKGELRAFRESLQIQALQMVRLRSTEEEVRFWAKVQAFAADVVARPWELDRRVVRQCRKEAENGEAKERREEKEDREDRDGKRQKKDTGRDTEQKGRSAPRHPPPRWNLGSSEDGDTRNGRAESTRRTGSTRKAGKTGAEAENKSRSSRPVQPKPPPPPRWTLG